MQPELSIVMPCLNEARTLAGCIRKAQLFLKEHGVSGEVIVADNDSTDGSIKIAEKMNARVVTVRTRGYGAALAAGLPAAEGKYVIMGDSDESYDFSALFPFVEKLRAGYDPCQSRQRRNPRASVKIRHTTRSHPAPSMRAQEVGRSSSCPPMRAK